MLHAKCDAYIVSRNNYTVLRIHPTSNVSRTCVFKPYAVYTVIADRCTTGSGAESCSAVLSINHLREPSRDSHDSPCVAPCYSHVIVKTLSVTLHLKPVCTGFADSRLQGPWAYGCAATPSTVWPRRSNSPCLAGRVSTRKKRDGASLERCVPRAGTKLAVHFWPVYEGMSAQALDRTPETRAQSAVWVHSTPVACT